MKIPFRPLFFHLLFNCLVFFRLAQGQPYQWQLRNEGGDSLRFFVRADTLKCIGNNLFVAELDGENIVFRKDPLHPLFRTRKSGFQALNERYFAEFTEGKTHIRECRNPEKIFLDDAGKVSLWRNQVLAAGGKRSCRFLIGDKAPQEADSLRVIAGNLFAYHSGGIRITDSLLNERFVKITGRVLKFNAPFYSFALCDDSTWIPLNGRSRLFREYPGAFWWNDTCLLDSASSRVFQQTPAAARKKAGEKVLLLSPNIHWLESNKKEFLVFRNGKKVAVPPSFEKRAISDSLCALRLAGNWVLVNRRGRLLPVKSEVSEIRGQTGEYLLARSGKRWGFTDLGGIIRISCRYDSLLPPAEGRIPARISGAWGYLDKDEHIRVQPNFESVQPFAHSAGLVKRMGKWGIIRPDGSYLLECEYNAISAMGGGKYKVSRGLWTGIFSAAENFLLNTRYSDIIEARTGLFQVVRDGRKGLFSKSGTAVLPLDFAVIASDPNFHSLICR